jgi:CheY-like chemotaxis protein
MEELNLLLVEDNEMNRFITSTYLRKWDVKVTMANNGQEAITLVQQHRFHVILMDLQMPVMDGLEATRIIRAMSEDYFRIVPIIAYSASTLIDNKEAAMKYGMTDFVPKPFDPAALREMVNYYAESIHLVNH